MSTYAINGKPRFLSLSSGRIINTTFSRFPWKAIASTPAALQRWWDWCRWTGFSFKKINIARFNERKKQPQENFSMIPTSIGEKLNVISDGNPKSWCKSLASYRVPRALYLPSKSKSWAILIESGKKLNPHKSLTILR